MRRSVGTGKEAVAMVEAGANCFVHTAMMAPVPLLDGLVAQRERFEGNRVNLYHLHTEGAANYLQHPKYFKSTSFFCAANDRAAVNNGTAEFIPVFLSEIPRLWKNGIIPLDYALLQVSPPDSHGYCSLGMSVDVSISALHYSKHVIAIVNKNVPRLHGDGLIHVGRLDTLVESDEPLHYHDPGTISEEERLVGAHVSELIPNGATIQLGIGRIPDSVLASLQNHSNLGVHSEMFSDGVMDLMELGCITGANKVREPFQVVGSFAVGSKKLCSFLDDNPAVKMLRTSYVNNPANISRIESMHAVNSCIEIDLTGLSCICFLFSHFN